MFNIKDKELRRMLKLSGILDHDESVDDNAYYLVSKILSLRQKMDAISEHLGIQWEQKETPKPGYYWRIKGSEQEKKKGSGSVRKVKGRSS